jgi:hypothetical protein
MKRLLPKDAFELDSSFAQRTLRRTRNDRDKSAGWAALGDHGAETSRSFHLGAVNGVAGVEHTDACAPFTTHPFR